MRSIVSADATVTLGPVLPVYARNCELLVGVGEIIVPVAVKGQFVDCIQPRRKVYCIICLDSLSITISNLKYNTVIVYRACYRNSTSNKWIQI